ncbi:hypothetical protein [Ktedonobacter robiniae]|uniref:Uncharacterized protein n=1 Tax=Ktedonobacter robiniae TaxID=2778365 RepID=A0ABQ3UJP9_9CHLR|nr:hypothetical protein [Ktedonobacter robiniae]GHO52954.1 hypothetical protein KSB_14290 [Ktedonobacter robiniae]
MTYTRQNSVEEQREASHQARRITTLCEEFYITLDAIDWQDLGMQAPVNVDGINIATLQVLSQRASDDILRQIQMKLFEHAALEAIHAPSSLKALIWSPIEVLQPQAFLQLWVVTMETGERVPVIESLKDGHRVYEHYKFDGSHEQFLQLFGPLGNGKLPLGERVTIQVRENQYTGEIIHILPPAKILPIAKTPQNTLQRQSRYSSRT